MKIKEYNQMMEYLTRPGKPNDMEIQVKKSVENNKNPGTFKKLVKEDEDNYQKSLKANKSIVDQVIDYSPNKIQRPKKKKDVFDTISDDFVKNYNLYDAEPGGEIVVNNNGQIMMESELKKQFEKEELKKEETKYLKSVYPKQASPEMVGKLAERLERNAQMSGGQGPFTKVKKKPEIKKPFKPGKTSYSEFKIDTELPKITSFYEPMATAPDPRSLELEARFKKLVKENDEEKERNSNSGIGGLLGGENNNE